MSTRRETTVESTTEQWWQVCLLVRITLMSHSSISQSETERFDGAANKTVKLKSTKLGRLGPNRSGCASDDLAGD